MDGGDGIYFVWLIRWYQKAIFELKISPFFNPLMNYPQGWDLASTDTTPAMVAIAMPANLLFGPVVRFNFSMLLSFILSGWGMFLWIRDLTKNTFAGLIAGTIYAFFPFHMAHYLIGHLSLAGMQWFPFYFWGLFDLLRQKAFNWKPVLMAGVSAGLIGATSPYYIYMTILISIVFLFCYVIFSGIKQLRDPAFWKSLILFGILSGILVAISMLPYFNLNSHEGLASRSVDYLSEYSASPTDFVIPSMYHFLWGKWVDDHFSPEYWQEATLYIGLVAFILVVVAVLFRKRTSHPELMTIAVLTAMSAFILALGIDLHWLGRKVTSLPTIIQPIFHRTDMPQIYLPSYYLFRFLPFFSKMRVMMRFGLFTLIFSSMMSGLGAHVILSSIRGSAKKWVGIGLLALIFLDFYPGILTKFSTLDARPVDYWLATQPDTGSIAQFPFRYESDQHQVYNTLVSNKPYLGGFFNANSPEQYNRIEPVMEEFPSSQSVMLLKELGVAYIIVDSSAYPQYSLIDQEIIYLGLQLLDICEQEYVYGWPK